MNYFEDDGVDNRAQIVECIRTYDAFLDAFDGLSECLQYYFSREFAYKGEVSLYPMFIHTTMALESFAELIGVDEDDWLTASAA